MTVKEAIIDAWTRQDALAFLRVCDSLRFKHGLTHKDTFGLLKRHFPDARRADFDGLIYDGEDLESRRLV